MKRVSNINGDRLKLSSEGNLSRVSANQSTETILSNENQQISENENFGLLADHVRVVEHLVAPLGSLRIDRFEREGVCSRVPMLTNICSNFVKRHFLDGFSTIFNELLLDPIDSDVIREIIASLASIFETNLQTLDPSGSIFIAKPAHEAFSKQSFCNNIKIQRILISQGWQPQNLSSVSENLVWNKLQEVVIDCAQWTRPRSDFIAAPELGRPPGGSSPVIHFFRDQEAGARWIGKLGEVPLRDKEVIEAARRLPGFLGVYAGEILEKLGLAVYQLLGTEVPESALSYQQVTMEAMHPDMLLVMQLNAEDEGQVLELPQSPRMHYLYRNVEELQMLDRDFVEHYLANAKQCGNEYVKIQTKNGEVLPLRGLGSMLATADFIFDLNCVGDSCGNAGYVIREDKATGERYAQLVKINADYAFSYSDLRTDQRHDPRDRQIRIAPNQPWLHFADLAPADQKEFVATARQILALQHEDLAYLFSLTETIEEGISANHWHQLLDELMERKTLFLEAFAPEIKGAITNESK